MDAVSASKRLEGARIGKFTLRFAHPDLETQYRREDTLANRLAVQQWSIWGIIVYVTIGIIEWRILPGQARVPMIVRFGTCLPVFIANYTLSFIIDYERFFIRLNPFSMIAAAVTTIFVYGSSK